MQGGRLFRLLYLLIEREGWTAGTLARQLEVSERTVRRDLDALSAAGIPVYTAQGRGGGVRLLPGFVLDRSLLSGKEQDEILYGLQTLRATGMASESDLVRQLSGLFRRAAPYDWIDADFSPWNGGAGRDLFDLMRRAILERHPLTFLYYGASGKTTPRTAEPVRLCFKGMSWYIQAWCRTRQAFRTFKLSRMAQVRLCAGQTFAPRPMPPLPEQAALETSVQPVTLRFAPEAAYRVYDEFDRAQIAQMSDGALIVRTAWPPGAWGVSYVLSYGRAAEVLEPAGLRACVQEEVQKIAEQYREKEEKPVIP